MYGWNISCFLSELLELFLILILYISRFLLIFFLRSWLGKWKLTALCSFFWKLVFSAENLWTINLFVIIWMVIAGDSSINVIAIHASVHPAYDPSYLLQNLSAQVSCLLFCNVFVLFFYTYLKGKFYLLFNWDFFYRKFLDWGCVVTWKYFVQLVRYFKWFKWGFVLDHCGNKSETVKCWIHLKWCGDNSNHEQTWLLKLDENDNLKFWVVAKPNKKDLACLFYFVWKFFFLVTAEFVGQFYATAYFWSEFHSFIRLLLNLLRPIITFYIIRKCT